MYTVEDYIIFTLRQVWIDRKTKQCHEMTRTLVEKIHDGKIIEAWSLGHTQLSSYKSMANLAKEKYAKLMNEKNESF